MNTTTKTAVTKKLLVLILAVVTAVSMALVIPAESVSAAGSSKVKTLKYSMKPAMGSITLKWKKQKVSYYLIYRTGFNVKESWQIEPVPMSKYKRVKKVSGKKTSWKDKRVKNGQYYSYVIRGYKKSKGKTVLVYDTFRTDCVDYQCPGLERPSVINGGYGEFHMNSKDKLYLYVQRDCGVRPDGVVIYRKAAGASKYKKIKAKKVEKGRYDSGKTYRDSSVKPGTVYYYKTRTYVKKNGKKKYSPYSPALKLSATNFKGKYTVKSATSAGTVKEFVVKLTSDKYNGVLTLKGGKGSEGPVYSTTANGRDYGQQQLELVSCSRDFKNWSGFASTGMKISGGQTVWLKFRFVSGSGYYSAASGEYSNIYMDCEKVDYDGSAGPGSTEMTILLTDGTASAFSDYDN